MCGASGGIVARLSLPLFFFRFSHRIVILRGPSPIQGQRSVSSQQTRQPERSASQIDRVTQRVARRRRTSAVLMLTMLFGVFQPPSPHWAGPPRSFPGAANRGEPEPQDLHAVQCASLVLKTRSILPLAMPCATSPGLLATCGASVNLQILENGHYAGGGDQALEIGRRCKVG